MTTHERYCPPRGYDYQLLFADDGYNAMIMGVTEASDDLIKTDAEVFSKFIHIVDGITYHYDTATGKNIEFEHLQARHRTATCNLRLGPTMADTTFHATVVVRPRAGNVRMFWSLADLYDLCGMDQYCYCSRWAMHSFEKGRPGDDGLLRLAR